MNSPDSLQEPCLEAIFDSVTLICSSLKLEKYLDPILLKCSESKSFSAHILNLGRLTNLLNRDLYTVNTKWDYDESLLDNLFEKVEKIIALGIPANKINELFGGNYKEEIVKMRVKLKADLLTKQKPQEKDWDTF